MILRGNIEVLLAEADWHLAMIMALKQAPSKKLQRASSPSRLGR